MVGSTFNFQIKGIGFPFAGVQYPNEIRWDSAKNEIQYARTKRGSQFEHGLDFTMFVAIQDKETTSADPAIAVFWAILEAARDITMTLEFECTRLGYKVR
jgi:hypothetical protein